MLNDIKRHTYYAKEPIQFTDEDYTDYTMWLKSENY